MSTELTKPPTDTIEEVVQSITRKISIDNTIVFIGAGLSRKLYTDKESTVDGYKTMKEFIEQLFDNNKNNMIDNEGMQLSKNEPPFTIIEKLELHNKGFICAEVKTEYSKAISDSCERYRTLISTPYKAFITLNFDPMLKKVSETNHIPILTYKNLSFTQLKQTVFPFSLYLHGIIEDAYDDLVFSESKFAKLYGSSGANKEITDLNNGDNAIFKCSFLSLILEHDLLFLGCSLTEEVFKILFPFVGKIVEKNRIWLVPAAEAKDSPSHPGITVIPYPAVNNDNHAGLHKILLAIKNIVKESSGLDFNPEGGHLE